MHSTASAQNSSTNGGVVLSVQNMHKINAVVRGGVYYSNDALGALKQRAAEHLASAPATPGRATP